jgi:hypothetical protein
MKRFEIEKQELFIALASILNTKGADIEMESSWDSINKTIEYINVPVIRGYMGPEGEGFYFRARRNYFGLSADKLFNSFPINIDGYKFEAVSFSDFEADDDRTWSESISFIITKDGINVLNK